MRAIHFTREGSDWDGICWRQVGREDFDATNSSQTLAHDVLEHYHGKLDIDPCADEMMALGAIHYGRGDGGAFWGNREPNIERILCHDIVQQATMYDGISTLQDPGRTCSLYEVTEDEITEMVRLAGKIIRIRRDEDEMEYTDEELARFLRYTKGWLRKGYRLARRRWEAAGQNSFTVARIFAELKEEIERATKYADLPDTMSIVVCMKYGTVKVTVKSPGYDEW